MALSDQPSVHLAGGTDSTAVLVAHVLESVDSVLAEDPGHVLRRSVVHHPDHAVFCPYETSQIDDDERRFWDLDAAATARRDMVALVDVMGLDRSCLGTYADDQLRMAVSIHAMAREIDALVVIANMPTTEAAQHWKDIPIERLAGMACGLFAQRCWRNNRNGTIVLLDPSQAVKDRIRVFKIERRVANGQAYQKCIASSITPEDRADMQVAGSVGVVGENNFDLAIDEDVSQWLARVTAKLIAAAAAPAPVKTPTAKRRISGKGKKPAKKPAKVKISEEDAEAVKNYEFSSDDDPSDSDDAIEETPEPPFVDV